MINSSEPATVRSNTQAITTDGEVGKSQSDITPRLLVNIVDEYATTEPERAYAYAPVSSDPEDGFKPITFKAVANAVNYIAHKITDALKERGESTDDFPTIAYIGPNDVRYPIMALACVKAHCKAFFISPRNSLAANLSLFNATNTHVIVYSDTFADKAQEWLAEYPMESIQASSPDVWLEAETTPFPYSATYEEARWHPYVAIHTSGSTGIPKPIIVRQGTFGTVDFLHHESDLNGAPSVWGHWLSGKFRSRHNASPPSILEDMATTEEGIKALASVEYVSFGGGNLAPAVGDLLTERGVKLLNIISSSECAPYHLHYQADPKLWNYFIINSKTMGAEFRELGGAGEGVYEMFIKRIGNDRKNPGLQTLFYTFPEKDEWSTGDLYKKHATLPDHYLYVGRSDNVIVFSNGEKLNPVTIEGYVMGHPGVRNAVVVGAQRFQPALILEPHDLPQSEEEAEALIESVWPVIEQANEVTVAHGRIARQFVTLADPTKPFMLTPKGTVQRVGTVKLYKEFIDELYEKAEEGNQQPVELDLTSAETLTNSIVDLLVTVIGATKVTPEADLFNSGVDSLQVISLSKQLQSGLVAAGLPVDKNTIAPRVIYANPIPTNLAKHLFSKLKGDGSAGDEEASEIKALAEVVEEYTSDLPAPNEKQTDPLDDGQTILITGTTGSLGAYMLDHLINNPRIKKVVAMNRGSDGGASRQPAFSAARGLSTDFSKVQFVGVDLSLPTWSLSQETYDELLANADRIIHNAWPVNFNINVHSFEPYIRGVRHLVDFSNKAAKRVAIIFVSSVSTVHGWPENTSIPEKRLEDLNLPVMGYGRSKAAGSLILDAAAAQSGVPTASIRVGLIVGPRGEAGQWNKQEYIPSLVASSIHLGVLPDSLGPEDVIDWTPVEDVAGIVLDVAGIAEPRPISDISGYFHCVNPNTASWPALANVVKEYYGDRIKKIVPLAEWVDTLEKSATNEATADAEKNPGIKLIDTYQGFLAAHDAKVEHVYFATERTKVHSKTMQKLDAVSGELMRHWCDQWKY
ncbi:Non-canonical non-ribosomal peptide synthetase FUB8-like protein [Cladobotryum mycophilum]|uniref:Non-canonical non-ribosomal peptide synthetase FUB8-like protein n=1 Tax=Cladobotryum mycophilum TaxID=491253 RepID=A0ABR0SVN3_9HYPO